MPDTAEGAGSARGIAALILAAGASTRLGQPKQLVWLDGESLLRRTARLAFAAGCAPVFVVLGFEADRMRPELNGLRATAVVNQKWAEGMGSSLRCGMDAIARIEPAVEAVLLLVCDQPRLTAQHLQSLLDCHRAGKSLITASFYADRAGVPAVFAATLFPELLGCSGDRGARDLIRGHSDQVQRVCWPAGELDVDRPQDLEELRQKQK